MFLKGHWTHALSTRIWGGYIPRENTENRKRGYWSRGSGRQGLRAFFCLLSHCRSTLENAPEVATLTEDDICLLLTAVLNNYVQMKVRELRQEQETEVSRWGSSPGSAQGFPSLLSCPGRHIPRGKREHSWTGGQHTAMVHLDLGPSILRLHWQ